MKLCVSQPMTPIYFFGLATILMSCSAEPTTEELQKIEKEPQSQIVDYQSSATESGIEHRYEENAVVFKKMSRLSTKPQTLSLLESKEDFHIVCEAFDELREEVKCKVESSVSVDAKDLSWKLVMGSSDEGHDGEIELLSSVNGWQVLVLSAGDWRLDVEHKVSKRSARIRKGQSVCHADSVEHVGADGVNRCLSANSVAAGQHKEFSHLRLVNLQAESQQALMLSSGNEILGSQGDRISLSLYTGGIKAQENIMSYGIPIVGADGKEVFRVCISSADLEIPGWLGAQFRLSGSQSLKVGRPIPANSELCRGQFTQGFIVWYEAYTL